MPQMNEVNESVRRRLGENFGQEMAYNYAYLYPGVQKVVQAAGRVIRNQTDKGVVFLMDDRFNRQEVRRLLPPWWEVTQVDATALKTTLVPTLISHDPQNGQLGTSERRV